MTTFSTLKTDIESFYPHSDYTDGLKGTFVTIAEAKIRRMVRVEPMVTTDTAFSQSAQSTPLPTRLISMRSVSLDSVGKRDMDYMPPARLRSAPIFDSTGDPKVYTIEGENLVVAPFDSTVTLQLVYYAMFAALSAPTDTNWLLTNAYDVYLYGALEEAAKWARDTQSMLEFKADFAERVEAVNREHRWSRVSGSALFRSGGATP